MNIYKNLVAMMTDEEVVGEYEAVTGNVSIAMGGEME